MEKNLMDWRLYGIIDLGYVEEPDLACVAEQMVDGGVDLIQLRGKGRSIEELADLAADRKSTRLNSSHGYISYAVFCLKKKKNSSSSSSTSARSTASSSPGAS